MPLKEFRIDSDSSSGDEEDEASAAQGEAKRRARATGPPPRALLERCGGGSPAGNASVSAEPEKENEKDEGVFEIRDFTAASSFERLTHQISMAIKRWSASFQANTDSTSRSKTSREEFDVAELKYELFFQYAPLDSSPSVAAASGKPFSPPPRTGVPLPERLGLHSFPTRTHRLQRWFGVPHFAMLSVREKQSIDLDSARTILSALVLAARSVAMPCGHPLSCFVPVDGGHSGPLSGRRRRFMGELVTNATRTVYTTDLSDTVEHSLEHLSGLLDFFWLKLGADPEEQNQSVTVGARFTYLADVFEPIQTAAADTSEAVDEHRPAGSAEDAVDGEDSGASPTENQDPIDSIQLHCLWPSFPSGSFMDNAIYSELDPRAAPYWKLRVIRVDELKLPRTTRLKNLLDFRKEARTVRSAEQTVQPQMPKTALASLSYAIQESLESILLPGIGEMMELTDKCMALPIVAPMDCGEGADEGSRVSAPLRGSVPGGRLARLAELGADMRCFKGTVMLWCQVLTQMRRQWDELEAPPAGAPSPGTSRSSRSCVRAEHFSTSVCLVQQKFEMLQRSVEGSLRGPLQAAAPTPTDLRGHASGQVLMAPRLVQPALLTEDMVLQRELAATGCTDAAESAEVRGGREIRADISAFKAANDEKAVVDDFLAWRSKVEHLSHEDLPEEWLARCWNEVVKPQAAELQPSLFEPEREAEMALHYLENIEGTQLLLQLFRVLLSTILEEMSGSESEKCLGHLKTLHSRAVQSSIAAFCPPVQDASSPEDARSRADVDAAAAVIGTEAEFPAEDLLQAVISEVAELEAATILAASLRAKLPGPAEALLEDLLADGEVSVTTSDQRQVVEELFERCRALSRSKGREVSDGKGLFESLPLAKEFILLLHADASGAASGLTKRMYAEVRERHLRLAISRGFRLV